MIRKFINWLRSIFCPANTVEIVCEECQCSECKCEDQMPEDKFENIKNENPKVTDKTIVENTNVHLDVEPKEEANKESSKKLKNISPKVTDKTIVENTNVHLDVEPKEVKKDLNKAEKKVKKDFFINKYGTLKFNNNVTTIKAEQFKDNLKIKKVIISSTINKIEKQAFYGCENLEEVIIENNTQNIPNIGAEAFCTRKDNKLRNLDKLVKIQVPESMIEEFKNTNGWKRYKKVIK